MRRARVTERGQVTIPKALRERLGIHPGTLLEFSAEKGRLVAVKADAANPVDQIFGKFARGRGTDDVVAEIRGER